MDADVDVVVDEALLERMKTWRRRDSEGGGCSGVLHPERRRT